MAKPQLPRFDPEAERTKLRAVVTARKLGGLANDTKWKELVETCDAMDWNGPRYRCKCIDSDNVSALNREWYAIPFPLSAIEWLEIFYIESFQLGDLLPVKTIDHSGEIEEVLNAIGLDYKKGKESFRVFGYAPRNEDDFDAIQGNKL
jgi:hypothetical protein